MALKEDVSRRGARTLAAGQFRCFRYRTKVSVNAVTFIVILAACAVQFVSGFSWYQPPSTTPKPKKCPNEPKTMQKINDVIKDCQDEIRLKIFKEAIAYVRDQHRESEEHHIHIHHAPIKRPTVYNNIGYHPRQPFRVKPSNDYEDVYYNAQHNLNRARLLNLFQRSSKPNAPFSVPNKVSPPTHTLVRYNDPRLQPKSQNGIYEVLRQIESENRLKIDQALSHIRNKRDTEWFHPNILPKEDKRIAGCLMHCIFAKNNATNVFGWPTVDGLVALFTDGVNDRNYFIAVLSGVDWCLNGAFYKYEIDHYHLPTKGESCDVSFDVFDCVSDKITDYCSENKSSNTTMMMGSMMNQNKTV